MKPSTCCLARLVPCYHKVVILVSCVRMCISEMWSLLLVECIDINLNREFKRNLRVPVRDRESGLAR